MARMVLTEQVEFRLRPKKFRDASLVEACVHQASETAYAKVPRQTCALRSRRREEWGLRGRKDHRAFL